jgi:hypothetical protein
MLAVKQMLDVDGGWGGYDETAPASGKAARCEGGVMLRWMGMFVSAGRGLGLGWTHYIQAEGCP